MNEVFREHMDFLDNPEAGITRRMKAAAKIWRSQGKSDEWIAERLFQFMPLRGGTYITEAIHPL